MTTTPAPEPTSVTTSPVTPVAAPAGSMVSHAVHWLETHVVPALKTVDATAERIITEAQKLEAMVEAADPALAPQLTASAAVLRDIATELAAL